MRHIGPQAVKRRIMVPLLALAATAALMTGCQSAAPEFDRALDVTALPGDGGDRVRATEGQTRGHSAGFDLHFGAAAFGLTCSTDADGDSSRGIAAVVCTWTNEPR
ncbi:hypothetical protein [Arthrobacter sp. UYCo732]|uniref:hypothetical protein n=1 Tax=Arthrobacter sp. UYCo732 TaxID=3156336 RepID=UPI003399836F